MLCVNRAGVRTNSRIVAFSTGLILAFLFVRYQYSPRVIPLPNIHAPQEEPQFGSIRLHCSVLLVDGENVHNFVAETNTIKTTWGYNCFNFKSYGAGNTENIYKSAFKHVDKSTDRQDWFFFLPSNTFAIPENAVELIKENLHRNISNIILGAEVRYGRFAAFPSFIVSASAAKNIKSAINNGCLTNATNLYRALYVCFSKANLTFVDTRDAEGRHRILPVTYNVAVHMDHGTVTESTSAHALLNALKYPMKLGPDCCSPKLVSMSNTASDFIAYYYYLAYKVSRTHSS